MKIEKIKNPKFLRELTNKELNELSTDIREFLINNISKTGGHLSSNLGIVELTIALHKVFDFEKDKIIFDVGHQAYVHKILTGRANKFGTLRQKDGLSGFQCMKESKYDCYEAGHSSTSISACLGYAISRDMDRLNHNVISVIGDGSIGNGLCYEAINNIAESKSKVIIILNDNEMSISKNIGAVKNKLDQIRIATGYNTVKSNTRNLLNKIPFIGKYIVKIIKYLKASFKKLYMRRGFIFEEMGLSYYGPINGHDFNELIKYLEIAKKEDNSVLLHVITKKGKGYKFAENDAVGAWHGVKPFDVESGKFKKTNKTTYCKIISDTLFEKAKSDKNIIAITPAMSVGSKLENFKNFLPNQFIDVGIAEEHALLVAASMGLDKKKPFVSIYSTFLQRGYDEIIHDIARLNSNVLVGVDRCGIIGEDGVSHQGIYDVSFLLPIPNITIMHPKDSKEAKSMIVSSLEWYGPKFIRYSKNEIMDSNNNTEHIKLGSWEKLTDGRDAFIITYGDFVDNSLVIHKKLLEHGINICVINARFLKPIDIDMFKKIISVDKPIFVYEESTNIGSLGNYLSSIVNKYDFNNKIYTLGISDNFVYHGKREEIIKDLKLDVSSVYKYIYNKLKSK